MDNNTSARKQPDYLYHYTSFETLALILTNRTIRFNSLLYVDDMEEAETEDMGTFGKFVYVSCWTDDSNESIALWNLYTPNMQGVRICLPANPFVSYTYRKGQYFCTQDLVTHINLERIYQENKVTISPDQPKLAPVKYTNNPSLLFPHMKTCNPLNAVDIYMNAKDLREASGVRFSYSYEKVGQYKRTDWEFQHEWRYIIRVSPMGLRDSNPPTFEKQQETVRRIEDPLTKAPYDALYLDLDENAVKQMRVILGPRMSAAEKIYVKTLLKDHGLENNWQESRLRIR